jgi:hypothetical protein
MFLQVLSVDDALRVLKENGSNTVHIQNRREREEEAGENLEMCIHGIIQGTSYLSSVLTEEN